MCDCSHLNARTLCPLHVPTAALILRFHRPQQITAQHSLLAHPATKQEAAALAGGTRENLKKLEMNSIVDVQ